MTTTPKTEREEALKAAQAIVSCDQQRGTGAYFEAVEKHALVVARALLASAKENTEMREALKWALAEIDVLSNRLCEFAYPQAMWMLARDDQIESYQSARAALSKEPS
jgi:hypothetical protein